MQLDSAPLLLAHGLRPMQKEKTALTRASTVIAVFTFCAWLEPSL